MLEINILGLKLYDLLIWFWIYSFLGWVFESIYSAIHEGRLVNRGFVYSPFCIIYGFGALIIITILTPLKNNIFLLFIISIILTSALEYLIFVIMERLFNQRWWDYSDLKFNYKGILSFESSIAWGILSVLVLMVIHPSIQFILSYIPYFVGEKIIISILIIYGLDFLFAVYRNLKKSNSDKITLLKVKSITMRKILVNLLKNKIK